MRALLTLLVVVGLVPARAADDFFNVLLQEGADPWMIRHTDGWYYYTHTTGGDVSLWRTRTITGLAAAERKVVWRPPAEGPASKNLWAPELHWLDGAWYVYVAADDGRNENHRMWVLENRSPDPFQGEWSLKGKIGDASDRWAIDGTVFEAGGRRWFVWSGWEGTANVEQALYIARMKNPWTLETGRTRIARPTLAWEANTNPRVLEGPQVVVRGDRVNLIYSASGSWTDSYCLGLAVAHVGSDLLAAGSWAKHPAPIFESGNGVVGPGHCSFVPSPDGQEEWLIYHAARFPGAGWTRSVRAQRIAWRADGSPDFGRPADPNRPIPIPSGERRRARIECETGRVAGTARVVRPEPSASGGAKVGYVDTPESLVEVRSWAARSGFYMLVARCGNGTAGDPWARYRLSVNGTQGRELRVAPSGWNRWGTVGTRVWLRAGMNRIRITRVEHYAEWDCVDLVRLSR